LDYLFFKVRFELFDFIFISFFFFLMHIVVDTLQLFPEPQYFFIQSNLLPDIADHELELGITVIEKSLVVFYLLVN